MNGKNRKYGLFAIFLAMSALLTLCTMNVAAYVGEETVSTYGVELAALFLFLGIIFLAVFSVKGSEHSPKTKSIGMAFGVIFMIVAAGIGAGVYLTTDAADDTAAATGEGTFGVVANPTNSTSICAKNGVYSYLWNVEYNTTSNLITNVTDTVQFNFTIARNEIPPLASTEFSTYAEIADPIPTYTNPATGAIPTVIETLASQYRITWTDSLGNTANQVLSSIPQPLTKIETVFCTVYLNDLYIEALIQDSKVFGAFEIDVAGVSIDIAVYVYNTYG